VGVFVCVVYAVLTILGSLGAKQASVVLFSIGAVIFASFGTYLLIGTYKRLGSQEISARFHSAGG
jgi:hypothetical protein